MPKKNARIAINSRRGAVVAKKPPPAPVCKHCGRGPLTWRRRGLCSPCYFTAAIRQHYPSNRDGKDVVAGCDFNGPARRRSGPKAKVPLLPGKPGSRERIAELARRAEKCYDLFSRGDWVPLGLTGRDGPRVLRLFVPERELDDE